jgi:hypothetical protein
MFSGMAYLGNGRADGLFKQGSHGYTLDGITVSLFSHG